MIAKLFVSIALVFVSAASVISFAPPVSAACSGSVFGFVPWYQHLTYGTGSNCQMKAISDEKGNTSTTVKLTSFIWTVALNIVQILLTAAAYVTLFFIIKGGFNYITSQGDAGKMTSAKQNIMNAIIGLVIALLASSIVNAIAGAIQ